VSPPVAWVRPLRRPILNRQGRLAWVRDPASRETAGIARFSCFRAHGELRGFVGLVPRLSGHSERRGRLTQGGSAHVEGP